MGGNRQVFLGGVSGRFRLIRDVRRNRLGGGSAPKADCQDHQRALQGRADASTTTVKTKEAMEFATLEWMAWFTECSGWRLAQVRAVRLPRTFNVWVTPASPESVPRLDREPWGRAFCGDLTLHGPEFFQVCLDGVTLAKGLRGFLALDGDVFTQAHDGF